MSERMTAIFLPGEYGSGLADRGRKTVPEMIATLRAYAAQQKAAYEAILAASDDDFRVETYVGVHVQRERVIWQKGRAP